MSSPFIEASIPSLAKALFDTSWQVAAIVLVVLMVQRLFGHHLSARWGYGLWLVVVLRLALFPIAPLEIAPQANPLLWRPPLHASSPAVLAPASVQPNALASPSAPTKRLVPNKPSAPRHTRTLTGYMFEPTQPATNATTQAARDVPWAVYLLAIWLVGAALSLVRLVLLELRFRRRWARLPTLRDARLDAALERARNLTGLASAPRIVEASFLSGPAVSGLRQPVLLVPPHFADKLDDRALELVLLHELFHLRHHDVQANVLLALVRSLFWFHPLARLALTRLFAERESLRDWEALAASQDIEPRSYAEVLLGLVDADPHQPAPLISPLFLSSFRRSPDLERRLLMITRFTSRTHRSWALGLLLCLSLGWLGFTGPLSATPSAQLGEPGYPAASPAAPSHPSANGQPYTQVRVQHASIETDWHRALREKLAEQATGQVQGETGAEALRELASFLDINLVIVSTPDGIPDAPIHLEFGAPATTVLDGLLRRIDPDLSWCLGSRSVLIGYPSELPADVELCLYDIGPFLDMDFDADDLAMLAQNSQADEVWDWDGVSIETFENQMIVRVDYRAQAQIESLLNRILNYDEAREAEVARGTFFEMSRSLLDVNLDAAPLGEVLGELATRTGFSIGCDSDLIEEGTQIDIEIKDASLLDILSLVALQCGTGLQELTDAAWIGTDRVGDAVMRIYPVEDIIESFDDDETALYVLDALIRDSINVDFWDENPASGIYWIGPYLIIGATPSMHAEIGYLIDAMRTSAR